jgi:hypothetical protein
MLKRAEERKEWKEEKRMKTTLLCQMRAPESVKSPSRRLRCLMIK